MKSYVIRGVPMAMQQDGWWLSAPVQDTSDKLKTQELPWGRSVLLIALVALADVLMWGWAAGVSLAVFCVALVGAAVLTIQPKLSRRKLTLIAGGTLQRDHPDVELVQPLSVVFLCFGLSLIFALIAGLRPDQWLQGAMRLWWVGPAQTFLDLRELSEKGASGSVTRQDAMRFIQGWALPLGMGVLFLLLFTGANPVLEQWVENLAPNNWPQLDGWRLTFWTGIALLVWPCLILWRLRERLGQTRQTVTRPRRWALINGPAMLRSLVVFNLMFAGQTAMDLAFLYGSNALPEGMSYATYAHRGAYPLLLTALLAGGFVLIARPFAKDVPLLRVLLLVWIVQTLTLVVASLVRLDVYIDVYGLTRLRMAALIWMGVVSIGLGILWMQVWQDKPGAWMIKRTLIVGGVVLYACAFVSFDAVMARYNLSHDVRLDVEYICAQSEAVLPEIYAARHQRAAEFCARGHGFYPLRYPDLTNPENWREWGFRNWRVRRSLIGQTQKVTAP